jgi:Fe-S cluster assembly iron-binding protein IscA
LTLDFSLSILSAKASDGSEATGLLLVDAVTLGLIRGSTLDYATELIGSSFRLIDNPQAKGAGCGCGVSWELKL